VLDDVITLNFNKGESFVLSAHRNVSGIFGVANIDGWLGASITSNKEIAIAVGNLLGGSQPGSDSRDVGFDQPVPESSIGREYIIMRGNGGTHNFAEYGIVIAIKLHKRCDVPDK